MKLASLVNRNYGKMLVLYNAEVPPVTGSLVKNIMWYLQGHYAPTFYCFIQGIFIISTSGLDFVFLTSMSDYQKEY